MPLPTLSSLKEACNVQLSSQDVHPALGEVNVCKKSDVLRVSATVLMKPGSDCEGWQTGVAIDASYSMHRLYGGSSIRFAGPMSDAEIKAYCQKGMMEEYEQDGQQMCRILNGAEDALVRDGVLVKEVLPNEVQGICRKVVPMLAGELDADGGCTVLYWAMGQAGSEIKILDDYTEETAKTAEYAPVSWDQWGAGTRLMPAIRYFMETFKEAPMGLYVFVTDGKLDDFEEVKEFTKKLSHDIDAKKVNPVKLVLIGLGPDVDVSQLEALDDLPDECDLPVDVWDHKIAAEMRSLLDIFAELVDENKIVAPSAEIQDEKGNNIRYYSDGLPAAISFNLPITAKGFKIVMPNGKVLEQPVVS